MCLTAQNPEKTESERFKWNLKLSEELNQFLIDTTKNTVKVTVWIFFTVKKII